MRHETRVAVWFLFATALVVSCLGCGGSKNEEPTAPAAPVKPAQQQMTPEGLRTVQAAAPFVHAIASQKYEDAYGLLSGYAKARMTLNQFVAPPDALTLKRDEQAPFTNVTAGDFAELMKKVEGLYGLPQSVESLTVFSTDRDVLNRRSPEESGVIESAFAVGAMPDLIPAGVRRASVHGQIATQLTFRPTQPGGAGDGRETRRPSERHKLQAGLQCESGFGGRRRPTQSWLLRIPAGLTVELSRGAMISGFVVMLEPLTHAHHVIRRVAKPAIELNNAMIVGPNEQVDFGAATIAQQPLGLGNNGAREPASLILRGHSEMIELRALRVFVVNRLGRTGNGGKRDALPTIYNFG